MKIGEKYLIKLRREKSHKFTGEWRQFLNSSDRIFQITRVNGYDDDYIVFDAICPDYFNKYTHDLVEVQCNTQDYKLTRFNTYNFDISEEIF